MGQPLKESPDGFPARLRGARVKTGWTMADVAEKVEVDDHTVYRWERGYFEPDLETIKKLAKLLKVEWVWLLSGEGKA